MGLARRSRAGRRAQQRQRACLRLSTYLRPTSFGIASALLLGDRSPRRSIDRCRTALAAGWRDCGGGVGGDCRIRRVAHCANHRDRSARRRRDHGAAGDDPHALGRGGYPLRRAVDAANVRPADRCDLRRHDCGHRLRDVHAARSDDRAGHRLAEGILRRQRTSDSGGAQQSGRHCRRLERRRLLCRFEQPRHPSHRLAEQHQALRRQLCARRRFLRRLRSRHTGAIRHARRHRDRSRRRSDRRRLAQRSRPSDRSPDLDRHHDRGLRRDGIRRRRRTCHRRDAEQSERRGRGAERRHLHRRHVELPHSHDRSRDGQHPHDRRRRHSRRGRRLRLETAVRRRAPR